MEDKATFIDSGPSGNGRGLLRLKYLNKAIIGTLEGTLEKKKGFVSSKVYCRSCMLYACAKLSQGSRDFFFFHEIFPPRHFSAIRYLIKERRRWRVVSYAH